MSVSAAVFCGSSMGKSAVYARAARAVGASIAARGWSMVYGGAQVGLMGEVADAALAGGAHVTGVLPHFLASREIKHTGLCELILVDDQETRKAQMLARADVAVILPGGLGTLDEAFEVWTGTQLGTWRKPVGFLNLNGYYAHLKAFVDHAQGEGFVAAGATLSAIYDDEAEALLDALHAWILPRNARDGRRAVKAVEPGGERTCPKPMSV